MKFIQSYLSEVIEITKQIDVDQIQKIIKILIAVRESKGRVFFLGVGGSAGNCSHAVNDFRKIANIECYSPIDNVAEITARTNDEGWETIFAPWLECSKINEKDCLFVLSVGGGNKENNISVAIIKALELAVSKKSKILGVVGREGGYTAKLANECIIIPTLSSDTITPHAESWQGVIWHLLVSHPDLQVNKTKW